MFSSISSLSLDRKTVDRKNRKKRRNELKHNATSRGSLSGQPGDS